MKNIYSQFNDWDLKDWESFVNSGNIDAQYYMGQTGLGFACGHGLVEVALYLIKKGANPNITNNFGNTPLHIVSKEELALALIENGANLNAQNYQEETPLCGTTNLKIITILIESGADIHLKNRQGEEPLEAILKNLEHFSWDDGYKQAIKDVFLKKEIELEKGILHKTLPKVLPALKKSEFRL